MSNQMLNVTHSPVLGMEDHRIFRRPHAPRFAPGLDSAFDAGAKAPPQTVFTVQAWAAEEERPALPKALRCQSPKVQRDSIPAADVQKHLSVILKGPQTLKLMCLMLLLACAFLAGSALAAESTGGTLPYEGWLKTLQQSLTGPVAFSVAMIGIVTCGATLILGGGEIGRFMQSLIFLVLVMTLLIGANALMTRFFNGASIGTVQVASLPAALSQSAGGRLIEVGDFILDVQREHEQAYQEMFLKSRLLSTSQAEACRRAEAFGENLPFDAMNEEVLKSLTEVGLMRLTGDAKAPAATGVLEDFVTPGASDPQRAFSGRELVQDINEARSLYYQGRNAAESDEPAALLDAVLPHISFKSVKLREAERLQEI